MTVREKIVVTETIPLRGFWYQFKVTCRRRGVPYSQALAQGARLWLDQLHAEGFLVEPSQHSPEPGDWVAPE